MPKPFKYVKDTPFPDTVVKRFSQNIVRGPVGGHFKTGDFRIIEFPTGALFGVHI